MFSTTMVSKRLPRKAKLKERQFVLRLPENQAVFLDQLVDVGLFKSMNDSVVRIIAAFISDLDNKVREAKK